jgi:hypothetical protein
VNELALNCFRYSSLLTLPLRIHSSHTNQARSMATLVDFEIVAKIRMALWAVSFAFVCIAAFFNFINYVVFLAAKKKVVRVYATWIVALVANLVLCRIFSMPKHPRKAMRRPRMLFAVPGHETAIPRSPYCEPVPTFVMALYVDLRPKLFHALLYQAGA